MAAATAVDPWTTACSPASMIFPGALDFTSISSESKQKNNNNNNSELIYINRMQRGIKTDSPTTKESRIQILAAQEQMLTKKKKKSESDQKGNLHNWDLNQSKD